MHNRSESNVANLELRGFHRRARTKKAVHGLEYGRPGWH